MAQPVLTLHHPDMGLNGQGGDNWSESAYIHNFLKYSLNVTDQALAGGSLAPFWVNVYGLSGFRPILL